MEKLHPEATRPLRLAINFSGVLKTLAVAIHHLPPGRMVSIKNKKATPLGTRACGGGSPLAEASRGEDGSWGGSHPAEAHGSEICGELSWGVMGLYHGTAASLHPALLNVVFCGWELAPRPSRLASGHGRLECTWVLEGGVR